MKFCPNCGCSIENIESIKICPQCAYEFNSNNFTNLHSYDEGNIIGGIAYAGMVPVHFMKLNKEPFDLIKHGIKTYELRLYDDKRKDVGIGDVIVFNNIETKEQLSVFVKSISMFDNFEKLYEEIDLLKCGYTLENINDASYKDMEKYYPIEKQNKYGVVAIEIALL